MGDLQRLLVLLINWIEIIEDQANTKPPAVPITPVGSTTIISSSHNLEVAPQTPVDPPVGKQSLGELNHLPQNLVHSQI
ncbi:hypothetical protein C5167_004345 [Papaver somniferum]|uniref:Uncharacterized protein n=1 Tax=Papaver somniferum TaxID=3469 RepID=A0A4Y7JB68_PAPSO|nr:hypothetical protein C5167_004345 [Papaver somniferum]